MLDLEWFLAVAYLIGGLNDLFLDLVFYLKPLRRFLAQGRENPRCAEWELHAQAEKSIAILIPAWDESAVIGAMLESTSDRLDYANYDIFVGCYPNDEATQFEVARAAFDRPRIHRVVCPNPGPTSKADCLNWIVEAIRLKETETGKRYEIFVLEDAEDVVHPLTLKVFNRFIPEYDLIQLPVIPYERSLYNITGNTYLDEFAETHLKSLTSRLAVGGMVPSAGVGTGFSRAACDELAEQTNHVLFPPVSLTEDYDFSFRLFRNQRKSGLAEVWVDRTDARGRHVKELVAIREFFPNTFGDAIRQKQRWLLGITFQGAQKLGWGSGWRERYMLLRDRVGVATSFLNLVALFIFFRMGDLMIEAHLRGLPWTTDMPPYDPGSPLAILIDINLLLLLNRIFQRSAFTARVARMRQIFIAPVRMLWSNVIDFYCAVHAVRRFTHSEMTGKPLKWLKTAHEYPNVETLLRRHRPLGDILLERRIISPEQLRAGLAIQSRPGYRDRYLGEILVAIPVMTQDDLLEALSIQTRTKITLREPVSELVDAQDVPLIINQVVKMPSQPLAPGRISSPSVFPSQLMAAAAAPGSPAMQFGDPVARATRPVLRSYTFQGAANRPRPNAPGSNVPGGLHLRPNTPKSWRQQDLPAVSAALAPQPKALVQEMPAPASLPVPSPARMAGQPEGDLAITRVVSAKAFPTATRSVPTFYSRRITMLHTVNNDWKPSVHKRFVVVIGTRPEAIKLSPVIAELRGRQVASNAPDDVFVCTTGQHQDMVLEPLALFGIVPDLDLGLMEHGQTLAEIGARVLDHFAQVLAELKPEWVIVQGDTATTAMAALAAFYAGVKVAHVEAGLRTHDLRNPFPEEANRRMVGIVTAMHFAATEGARKNLLREGVQEQNIRVTGNTGIDALRLHCERLGLAMTSPTLPHADSPLRILVTAHRRENLESGIHDLCQAIHALVEAHPDRFHFVWPLHPNPRVSDIARRYLAGLRDVTLTAAVSYDRLLALLAQCDMVVTDSGGLQEEAPSFGKPVLILREATERPEGVWAGIARLVGTDPAQIQAAVETMALQIEADHARRRASDIPPALPENPYGDGRASTRIADYFADKTVREFAYAPAAAKLPGFPHSRSNSGIRQALQSVH